MHMWNLRNRQEVQRHVGNTSKRTPGETQVIDYINEMGQDASVSAAFCQNGLITLTRAVCMLSGAHASRYLCSQQCM